MQANELFIQPNTILLDGGMGTMLQAAGLKLGARPEELNITDPQLIESIHSRYAAAGSRIINYLYSLPRNIKMLRTKIEEEKNTTGENDNANP